RRGRLARANDHGAPARRLGKVSRDDAKRIGGREGRLEAAEQQLADVHQPEAAFLRDTGSSTDFRNLPVKLSGARVTSSGVPATRMRPPPSPPSGPRSITQSAVLMTSMFYATTTT